MPHFRKRQTNRLSWTVEDLERAAGEGMGTRQSTRNFNNKYFEKVKGIYVNIIIIIIFLNLNWVATNPFLIRTSKVK